MSFANYATMQESDKMDTMRLILRYHIGVLFSSPRESHLPKQQSPVTPLRPGTTLLFAAVKSRRKNSFSSLVSVDLDSILFKLCDTLGRAS